MAKRQWPRAQAGLVADGLVRLLTPTCDRIRVEGGISLFINEGSGGEIALCQDCFQRHMKEGTISVG